jgi:hypothetical protein
MLRSRTAGSYDFSILIFWGLSILFSIMAVLIYISTNSIQGIPLPHSHWYLLSLEFLIITMSPDMGWYSIVVLICIYQMINDVEYFFHICMFSLEKISIQFLWPFFNWIIGIFPVCLFCSLVQISGWEQRSYLLGFLKSYHKCIFIIVIRYYLYLNTIDFYIFIETYKYFYESINFSNLPIDYFRFLIESHITYKLYFHFIFSLLNL